jgi:integrase/recombinase XerD
MGETTLGNQEPSACRGTIDDIIERLESAYQARGWSRDLFINDRAILRRIGVHPDEATLADLERVVMRGNKKSSRAFYVARLKSLWRTMNRLELTESTVAQQLPAIPKPRSVPRPLTHEEAATLMTEALTPARYWFILGCRAGLRAMEVAGIRGTDFTDLGDGRYELRIRGKGGTDLTIPAHPDIAQVFEAVPTLGTLFPHSHSRKLSVAAGQEMRRLGIHPSRARFHSCRHYFATSVLEASGWDLLTTSKLMRHANINTTTGYTALRQDRPREVLALL